MYLMMKYWNKSAFQTHAALAPKRCRRDARQEIQSADLSILHQETLVQSPRDGRNLRHYSDMNRMHGLLAFFLEDWRHRTIRQKC